MNRKRNNQIVIRLSDEEKEMLKRKVEQSGKTQQEFLISMLINGTVTNTDGVKELFPEVKRIGNNLNQIARSCNIPPRRRPSSETAAPAVWPTTGSPWQRSSSISAWRPERPAASSSALDISKILRKKNGKAPASSTRRKQKQ